MESVFFYGLFMDEDLLRAKGCDPSSCVLAHVDDYELRIGERATLAKSQGCRAYGLVADLSTEDLNLLYSDPSVAEYQPEVVVAIEQTGKRRSAISYLVPIESLTGKNQAYAVSLVRTAVKLGLPQAYIDEIGTWVSKDEYERVQFSLATKRVALRRVR